MNKDELIAKQQLEIEHLKEKVAIADKCRKKLHMVIFCIGGPLNDNKYRYTKEQLWPFAQIVDIYNL